MVPIITYQYGRIALIPELEQGRTQIQTLEQELQQTQEEVQILEHELEQIQALKQELKQELKETQERIQELEEKQRFQITCELSTTSIEKGQDVTISGVITPPIPTVITIEIKRLRCRGLLNETAWTNLATVASSSNGSYSYLWNETSKWTSIQGIDFIECEYQVRARWIGNNIYCGAVSPAVRLTIDKITPEEYKVVWPPQPGQIWIDLRIPMEINQVNYYQHLENINISYNIPPSEIYRTTDAYKHNYSIACWNEYPGEPIIVTIETEIIKRITSIAPVITSDPYPIPKSLIPRDVIAYLKPTMFSIESDDPAIKALAQNLSQGCTYEIEVVNKTLKWVRENLNYTSCGCAVGKASAAWVLEHRLATCNEFALLTVALLRANEIPAQIIYEFREIAADLKPIYLEPIERKHSHVSIEVYFPEVGWVHYDPVLPINLTHIPYGIPFEKGMGIGWGDMPYENYWCDGDWTYHVEGTGTLENNKVKLSIIISFTIEIRQPEG